MVAIDTTRSAEVNRKASLARWLKRTQEVLAFRSKSGGSFHRLFNLLRTKRLVELALDHVLSNAGARTAGVDGVTKQDLREVQARQKLMDEIHRELCTKTYRPQPVRRVYIPKPNGERRPLGVPTIKDRVVQEMLRLILEPIYEVKFYPHSYGFRPFRSTHHAALRVKDLASRRGYRYAVEGDIRKCFDRVQHAKLLAVLRRTIQDERVIKMVGHMLKAGVMEDGAWHVTDEGTPQGGILSPLLANIYLNELDWFIVGKWEALPNKQQQRLRYHGQDHRCFIVRYADDFVVMTRTEADALTLKREIAEFLRQELGLELSEEKTLVTPIERGIDFLGFHIRKYPRATLITPAGKSMARFKVKVAEQVRRDFEQDDVAGIVNLNRLLIGWGMYYRRVSSARAFRALDSYVWHRVWKTTLSLRRGRDRTQRRQHYRRHYIPYRFDINAKNRWRRGRNYGAWADAAHKTAYIVVRLAFLPIRYVDFHPQLNPFDPIERAKLEQNRRLNELFGELERNGNIGNPAYGAEWEITRREILQRAGYRCQQCHRSLRGRQAHVHHRLKLKQAPSRRQANLLENLMALCPRCHKREDATAVGN